jgi:alanine dehydrogenase
MAIAERGFDQAVHEEPALRRGTYTHAGGCRRPGLAASFGVDHVAW